VYRREHDTAYVDVVEPHFTLVFACQEVPEREFRDHVREVSKHLQLVKFVCRYAMLGVDHASPTGHVFLVPDEGHSAVSLCHDKLYAGPLAPFHRLDIPFTPHIAVGTVPRLKEAKRLCDDLNRDGLEIVGRIDTLTVSELLDNRIRDIEHHRLGEG
jgi:hypothetical protein